MTLKEIPIYVSMSLPLAGCTGTNVKVVEAPAAIICPSELPVIHGADGSPIVCPTEDQLHVVKDAYAAYLKCSALYRATNEAWKACKVEIEKLPGE